MTFTQGALLVCCAGATATLSASMFLIGGQEQSPVTLSQLTNDQTKDYSNKVGKKYEYFLVNPKGNERWWEDAFKKLQSKNPSDASDTFKTGDGKIKRGFKDLSKGSTSTNTDKALNEACEEVYKKDAGEADPTSADTNKKKLGQDLFKYCTLLGGVPKTAQDHTAETVTHSKLSNDKAKLIATSSEDNNSFWTTKDSWFNDLNITDSNNYFKTQKGTGDNRKSLKDVCQAAYQASVTNDTTDPKKDDIIKYCSFDTSGVTRST